MILPKTMVYHLQIYKIDKVKRDPNTDPKLQLYQIYFCSPEMYKTLLLKLYKAYAGPIENAVKDILRNFKIRKTILL